MIPARDKPLKITLTNSWSNCTGKICGLITFSLIFLLVTFISIQYCHNLKVIFGRCSQLRLDFKLTSPSVDYLIRKLYTCPKQRSLLKEKG